MMSQVMIAAANMALRVGLRTLLEDAANEFFLEVSAEAASLETPLPPVDVILAAGELKVAISTHQKEDLPALLVIARDTESAQTVLQGWPGNLWGVIDENSSGTELAAALTALAHGLQVGSPGLLESIYEIRRRPESDISSEGGEPLTPREREVLAHLARGLANKQIGILLGISEHTVKFHVSAIYAKLGVNSRMEAVRAGVKQGLVAM